MASKNKNVVSEKLENESILPERSLSDIKNKEIRKQLYAKMRKQKKKDKIALKKRKKTEAKMLGDEAPPKQVPKTLENMRIKDETMVTPDDEEVIRDESQDEMASYFNRESTPKILVTSDDRINSKTRKFCKELARIIPNAMTMKRRGFDLKKIIPQAIEKEFTDLIIINEDRKIPNGMVICHLPNGPTAHFKLSSVQLSKEIKGVGEWTSHKPEVILNNFNTRLGHSVGRMFASLFPYDPNFQGRRVMTFHNQRDFIFFRQHRYIFRNSKRVGLHELGPRFTLKLRSLQKGTFNSKYGEYEWVHKRHEMEASRRKFHL
ncbi:hypothetical protein SNE40_011658 [Patella caerulea]|uniref:Brix domain-containing protein n=1 Tax=Patella caerulea TaxID=87958 RepID=A0AAN8JPS6_PATCE